MPYQPGEGIIVDVRINDILTLKKKHPCGSNEWKVLRIGMDFKLVCLGCGHEIMAGRGRIEKSIKSIKREMEN